MVLNMRKGNSDESRNRSDNARDRILCFIRAVFQFRICTQYCIIQCNSYACVAFSRYRQMMQSLRMLQKLPGHVTGLLQFRLVSFLCFKHGEGEQLGVTTPVDLCSTLALDMSWLALSRKPSYKSVIFQLPRVASLLHNQSHVNEALVSVPASCA